MPSSEIDADCLSRNGETRVTDESFPVIIDTTILPPVVASSPKKPVISRKRRLREAVNEMSMRMLKHKGTSSL